MEFCLTCSVRCRRPCTHRSSNSYTREGVISLAPLLQAIAPRWPYAAEAFLATDGGFDAMNLLVQKKVLPGDRVIIEDPTATRLLDILDNVGAEILPLACDDQGPLPEVLSLLLEQAPVMLILSAPHRLGHRATASARRDVRQWRRFCNRATH